MKGNLIMKRMNVPKIVLVTVLAGSMAVMAGCASQTGQAATTQTAKVTRGNLTTDIVAGGNLQLAQKEDLAFQVAGTVAEVLVRLQDAVEKGQVIARLDNSTLEDNVKTAERAVKSAEIDLSDAEGNVFQIKTAEYNLETATLNFNKLNYPYTFRDE
jgi:multidrug efflux pump subunit AcrA (membrane-fusion protein)